jgi:aminopeptidase N
MKKPFYSRLVLLALVLFVAQLAYAARVERLIDSWQPKHYAIDLSLNDQLSEIVSATARIDVLILKPTTMIDLDFGELAVEAVTLNSKPVLFTHRAGKLNINLALPAKPGAQLQISVQYHGKPKDGLILSNDKDGKPSAFGDNWPNRVHHWIPALDHPSAKATVTFNITAPASNEVVANGRLERVETTTTGTRTWTYSEGVPIPPYCMVIAVGQFKRFEPTERSLTPLSYYVPHSDAPFAIKGFAPTNPSIVYFSETIAPYPYEKLAMIVGATRYGGMENSSAIVFSTTLFDPRPQEKLSKTYGIPNGIVTLIAHEIAHQWFGDSVTESTWADLWLSEGFATYFAGLFLQRYESEEAFQAYMQNAATQVFEYEKKTRTPIFDRDTEDLMDLLNANSYQKGAWVLHMLRSSLGDEVFFRGIRDYYRAHAGTAAGAGTGTATTEDLRAALEKASGRNLRPFFTRWIYDSGHPQYELSWEWQHNRELRLMLRQVQPGNPFLDLVPITIRTASGNRDVLLRPTGKAHVETIELRDKPLGIDLDRRNMLLKEATVRNP